MHRMSPQRERLLKCLVAAPLGAAFVAIGVRHFTEPSSFDDIVPAYLGWPRFWTYASGVFEVTLGAGLCAPVARAISAKMLIYLVLLGLALHDLTGLGANCKHDQTCEPWIAERLLRELEEPSVGRSVRLNCPGIV